HGNHGVGKTSLVRNFAEKHNMRCTVLNLANQSPEDLLGQIDGKGGYYLPDWITTDNTPTIYFLDEINRAPKFVLQCMFNFILEGRIHKNQVVKEKDMVIAAANPPSENYEVLEFEDDAFNSRFAHFILSPTKQEFIEYLNDKEIKNNIIQKAVNNSKILFQNNSINLSWKGSYDNRNLERCALLLEHMSHNDIKEVGLSLMTAFVGYDAASIIMNEFNSIEKTSFEDVVKKGTPKDLSLDSINYICMTAPEYLKSKIKEEKLKLTKKDINSIFKYIKSIPRDSQVAFLNNVSKSSIGNKLVSLFDEKQISYISELINRKQEDQDKSD
ncbi:MAG: AAA family ATPase, partial [Atribacterota bacterium]